MSLLLVFRNVFSNCATLVVSGLASFVLTPVLLHYLQPGNYAILAFVLVAVTIPEALDLGLSSALVRFVSDLATRGLYVQLKRLVSTIFYLLLGLGIVGVIGVVALSPLIASFFHIGGTISAPGHLVLALVGLQLAFQLPSAALRAFLEGCQDFHLANAVDIATQILRAIAILALVHARLGLLPIAALFPAAALMRLSGMLFMARCTRVSFSPNLSEVDLASLKRIRSSASLSFAQDTLTRLFSQSDSFVVAKLLPLPELAILVIARRFPYALTSLSQQALWVGYPMISSAAARRDQHAMEKFMVVSTRNLLALVLPLAAALFIWSEVILRLWVGTELISGVVIFRIFLVSAVFAAVQESPLTLLYGLGRLQFSAGLALAMLFAAVGLGSWACSRAGLLGLALVYASIQSVATSLLCWKALEIAEVATSRWLKKALLPVIIAELPTTAWFLASHRLLPHSLTGLSISLVAGLLLFFAIFAKLVAGPRTLTLQSRVRKLLVEVE